MFDAPRTITSETSHTRHGVRLQRYRVTDDVWVTVLEDGRIQVASYTNALVPTEVQRRQNGAKVVLRLEPMVEVAADDE